MGAFKDMAIQRGLSHRHDPRTSHAAARAVVKSGKLEGQCQQVHDALKRFPMHTARELSVASGIDYYVIQKRICLLERQGLAIRRGERLCTVGNSGIPVTQWDVA